jgi:hypothetical protein
MPEEKSSAKYPLAALEAMRAHEVDLAARALSEAVAAREAASRGRARAAQAAEAHEAAARAAREAHQAALARGELRAVDLLQADAWEAGVRAEGAALARELSAAVERERAAEGREATARGEAAAREADDELVARHRARFEAGVAAAARAREEDDAETAFLGQKRTR